MEDAKTVGDQIERLTSAANGKLVEISGTKYSTTPLWNPRKAEAEPGTLVVHTLQSLAEYAKSGHDKAYRHERDQFVHVESPTKVALYTGVFGDFNQRVALAEAVCPPLQGLYFGKWMDAESFNIMLLTHFVRTEEVQIVQRLVGNLQAQEVQQLEDDGVTQHATVRAGVIRVGQEKVPSPVTLEPFRTFTEVGQVASPFVLRLRGGDGQLPQCALFEADGGRWKLERIEYVKTWLEGALQGVLDVFG